jgi:hypothetical protein
MIEHSEAAVNKSAESVLTVSYTHVEILKKFKIQGVSLGVFKRSL